MNNPIDSRDINDMVVGISREMRQRGGNRHADANTLFFGGARPDDADLRSLADFGLRKNYNIIYSSFDRPIRCRAR